MTTQRPPHDPRPSSPDPGHAFGGRPAIRKPGKKPVVKRPLTRRQMLEWRWGGYASAFIPLAVAIALPFLIMNSPHPNVGAAIGMPIALLVIMAPGWLYLLHGAKKMERQLANPDQDIFIHPDDDPQYRTPFWRCVRFLSKIGELIG